VLPVDADALSSRGARRGAGLAWAVAAAILAAGCAPRESAEVARARVAETFVRGQIADLQALIAKTEAGDVTTAGRIAIGISEEVAKRLLEAPLPRETVIGKRFRVRVDSVQPLFRGNKAVLVFHASVRSTDVQAVAADLEIAGSIESVRIREGTLLANVTLRHFQVIGTPLGDLGAGVLEGLVRENADVLGRLLQDLELPVRLEHSIELAALEAGPVSAAGGVLPLQMSVAEIMPVRERLWVLLDAQAGPWKRHEAVEAKP
jgi:hypothetical protein